MCRHSEVHRIEALLVGGRSVRFLGKKFGVHYKSMWLHLSKHISAERRAHLIAGPAKLAELAEKAAEEGLSLLDYLGLMRSSLLKLYFGAAEAGDVNGASFLSGRVNECLRMQAQLTGELTRAGAAVTNNTLVLASPMIADLQRMLATRLRPYPDAARAVFEGLEELSTAALNDVRAPTAPRLLEAVP